MRHHLPLPPPETAKMLVSRLFLVAVLATFTLGVAGCMSVPERNPLPAALADQAVAPGGAEARAWGDAPPPLADRWFELSAEEMRGGADGIFGREHNYLAISGGGADGAFGAGLLCGWTEAGTRPEFTVVTGVSTGALIAPFAFLGSDYDHLLRRLYTTVSTKDIIEKRSVYGALTSDAASSSEPLQKLLAELITDELVQAIAVEYRRGRHLTIGTTNLDASRPVHWNIGKIAASGHPGAANLIRQVLLASASVPAAFPPVFIEVEAGGATYDELHVDGGATAQIYIYPSGTDWERVLKKLEVPGRPKVYLIRNSRFRARYEAIKGDIFSIIGRSLSSMTRTQGIGNMYQIYLIARRHNLDYRLAFIPADFDHESTELFDREYMQALFEVGFKAARSGYSWERTPPGHEQVYGASREEP